MSVRLTKANALTLNLPQGRSEAIYFDDDVPGFGLRIRSSGAKSWVFQYDFCGKTKRLTLGKASALDPAKARAVASQLHAKIRLGEDPSSAKAESKARAAETFAAALEPYLAWHRSRVRSSTYRHTERYLSNNLKSLHGLPIAAIDRRVLAAQLQRMAATPITANRARSSLAAFLNWCLREGLIDNNAALATNKNAEQTRDRVLSPEEIRRLWLALPQNDYGDIVRILLLTGQRANEIAGLEWREINFDKGIIELSAHRVKNRRKHIVPMSSMMRAILKARQQDGDFVFGRCEATPFSGWGKAKGQLDAVLNIPKWKIHDIRRTAATQMAEIGIQPHIIEAVLNHISGHKGGVAGIYNRAAYETEKATALNRWAAHVAVIIEGKTSNVKSLVKLA